jgi:hypothetical protein
MHPRLRKATMRKNISTIFDELKERRPHILEDEKLTFLYAWKEEGFELKPEDMKKFLECTNPSMIELLRKKKLEELGESGKEARQKQAMTDRIALNDNDVLVEF